MGVAAWAAVGVGALCGAVAIVAACATGSGICSAIGCNVGAPAPTGAPKNGQAAATGSR
ncbi:GH16547 [Drosophila grimshawi]|uniref:GH16547 n=1 Tax=Drosophila grimshawi TaxID=7222 RepID=B4J1K9_DROGR|nr:GH16547 [Drosophila grimshawi]